MAITGLDDLLVSLGTDAAMVAGMGTLYGLLRRGMKAMVKEEITAVVHESVTAELGTDGQSPREVITALREGLAQNHQAVTDQAGAVAEVSGQLRGLRQQFFTHIDRQHLPEDREM